MDTPKVTSKDSPTAAENEAIRAPDPEQCPACGGGGQVIVGEHFVTADMASDAGEPSMAGMHYGYEWGECDECGGSGSLESPPAVDAVVAVDRGTTERPRATDSDLSAVADVSKEP